MYNIKISKSGDILIPFGISENNQIVELKLSQAERKNAALIIGKPGAGKSVLLHTLIQNAVKYYSPDELNLYLIDFSGPGFNRYYQLPHVKELVSEAARDRGLSALDALHREVLKRIELCRTHGANSISELKVNNPSLNIPFLLLIVDEPEVFFNVENDIISQRSQATIYDLIVKCRKLGIYVILSMQRLSLSICLLKDFIANRIVFDSILNDFSSMITLPIEGTIPQLNVGECIYNTTAGLSYDNHIVKVFNIIE